MPLTLHTIKPAGGTVKKRKRVGRGNASGHGTYSTRGLKGQKSRAGVSGLKRLGMRQTLLKTPKKRGFKSLKPKDQTINIGSFNTIFHDGDKITVKALIKKGLIANSPAGVKILGQGDLTLKKLQFEAGFKYSRSAKEKLEKNNAVLA